MSELERFVKHYFTCLTIRNPTVLFIAGTYSGMVLVENNSDPNSPPYDTWDSTVKANINFFEWQNMPGGRYEVIGIYVAIGLDLRDDYKLINGRRNLAYPVSKSPGLGDSKPEVLKLPKPPLPHHPHKCPRCSAPAYISALSIECQKGCFQ